MKPSEIELFTSSEQTLLVATESARLDGLSEDDRTLRTAVIC